MTGDVAWDGLDEIPWAVLKHNYGTAEDVPVLLRACAGTSRKVALKAADDLDNHLYHQGGWVCPAAPAALPFLVRLGADPAVTVRVAVLQIVSSLARTATEVQPKWIAPAWPAALDVATPALLGLLADPEPEVRRAAIYLAGVGGLAGDLAIPALRERLDEELDPAIVNDVVVALGHAAARTTWSREVGEELALTARDAPGIQQRLAAVHALADGMGKPATDYADLLIDAVTHPTAAGWQHSKWLGGTIGRLVSATGCLLLGDPAAAVTFAVGVSERGDAQHRVAAMNHLGALVQEWRAVPASVVPFLAGQLPAPEAETRFRAAYLLAGIGHAALPYADQFAVMAGDDSPATSIAGKTTVGDAAVWALIRLKDPRCIPELRSRISGDRTGFPTTSGYYGRYINGYPWFSPSLPSIGVAVTEADPGAELLAPVIDRLRLVANRNDPSLAALLCEALAEWGAKSAPAVRSLCSLLAASTPGRFPSQAAATALGRIGPNAAEAAAELRRHARLGCPGATWALWKVTGETEEPLALLAEMIAEPPPGSRGLGRPDNRALRYLADLGPRVAGFEARLRDLLSGHPDDWPRTEAAHVLWRVTGDAATAITALAETTRPLADGSFLPVRLAAMRYLAAIPDPDPQGPQAALIAGTARAILANPRRMANSGGWRTFAEDDQLRATATAYLSANDLA
jgi:HEAT repeat protein